MSFTCPLCREEWLIVQKLCVECEKIRFIMASYSRDRVISVLEKIFLVDELKDDIPLLEEDKYIKDEEGKWKETVKKI